MRRLVVTGAALAVLASSGIADATAPPDTSPTTDEGPTTDEAPTTVEGTVAETTSAEDSAVPDTAAAGEAAPATIYDESGEPVATITVVGTNPQWTDYADGAEPDEGNEYVQVTVDVASTVTDGTFGISAGDFILQDQQGVITSAETVASAAQAESEEDIVDEADLANGESLELALTFQVSADVGPQSVFYRPDDDRLVDITEVA